MKKVILLTPLNIPCGIASYSSALIPEIEKHCQLTVLVEGVDWFKEDNFKIDVLERIVALNPDVVLFSHEYSYWSKSYQISTFTSYLRWKGIKTTAILHSVYKNHEDKVTTESSFDSLIVHTEGAKNALIKKGINCPINVVGHGTEYRDELLPRLWDHIGSQASLVTMGFAFKYKGWVETLDIIASLKKKWPDIQYIILGSISKGNKEEHDYVFDAVMRRAEELDLLGNVSLQRGFFSEELLLSYCRTAKICLLNYKVEKEHELFAASGISKICAQTCVPIITSSHSLFEDIRPFSLMGETNEEIEQHIVNVLENRYPEKEINEKRLKFLQGNCWKNAGQKIIEIL